MPTFQAPELMDIACRLLEAIGATSEEARIVGDHLVCANLAGHDSHGMIRIPQYYAHAKEGRLALGQEIRVERDTSTTAIIDGASTWGPVVATRAVDLAIEKASAHALAAVAVKHCYHVGRVGVYPLRAAERGFIAKVWCNGHGIARVAPWGGTEPRMGTNPISIAIPTSGAPLLVDITTSVVAEGKVRVAKNKGASVPDGWLLDKEGQPTNDPNDLYAGGSLLPFGGSVGHKGSGLSLVVDLLGGALTGDGCGAMPGVPIGNGLFIELVDPTAFLSRSEYSGRVDEFIAYVTSSKPKPGIERILLPGEPERVTEEARRRDGIPLDEETWRQVNQVAAELGVEIAPAR